MKRRFPLLLTQAIVLASIILVLSTGANAQTQDTGVQPIHFEAPATITVEADATPRADRRVGRSRVHHSLNEYRLRRSDSDGMGKHRVRFVNRYSGTLAYNPADPIRWHGPTSGFRNFRPHITVQHRRLFNPH